MPPVILIVSGFWEGPSVFDGVSSIVEEKGFTTEILL
jgi:hypothetical protein